VKYILLALILIFTSTISLADPHWVSVGRTADKIDFYYDVNTIRKVDGNILRIWVKVDESLNKEAVKIKQFQLDCAMSKLKLMYMIVYGDMDMTKTIFFGGVTEEWSPIVSGTKYEVIKDTLCTDKHRHK